MAERIPQITDERLNELAARIKPVVTFDGVKRYIEPCDLRRTAYTWSPKPAEEAPEFRLLATVQTFHTYGYAGFFKPSIAEVICQIPETLLDQVVAFELVSRPGHVDNLNSENEALNEGYHVGTAALYALK